MRNPARTVLATLVVIAAPAVAAADGFVTLDRQSGTSSLGIEGSFVSLSGNNPPTSLRFDLHGQYVGTSGLGVYLTLPFGYLGSTDVTPSISSFGDIEVGGIYVHHMGPWDAIFHVGLTLPTQSNGFHNTATTLVPLPDDLAMLEALTGSRLTDLYLFIPHGTSLRFGGAMFYRRDALIARVEVGLDVNLAADDGLPGGTGTEDAFLRINGGIGARFSQLEIMGEVVNLYDNGNKQNSFGSSWLNQAAISARFLGSRVHPYLAVVFGLDDQTRNVADVAVTLGIDALLR